MMRFYSTKSQKSPITPTKAIVRDEASCTSKIIRGDFSGKIGVHPFPDFLLRQAVP